MFIYMYILYLYFCYVTPCISGDRVRVGWPATQGQPGWRFGSYNCSSSTVLR